MAVKRHGHLSGIPNVLYEPNKQKAVKEHADTPNDLNKSILKKRKTMEGQGLESEISEDLYEPISKKRKMERHVPSEVPKDFNVFIPKKRRTVKERGLPSKEPRDLYELYNGYPSEIPRNLYDNAVKGLGMRSHFIFLIDAVPAKKRAVAIRKYLETNEGNRILNLRLQCAERCIDTHSRYLKYAKQLPRDWKYHPYFWKV